MSNDHFNTGGGFNLRSPADKYRLSGGTESGFFKVKGRFGSGES